MTRMRPLSATLAAVALLTAVTGCSEPPAETETTTFDVASLPGLGETQQQMLDLILDVHTEIRSDMPDTDPWEWLSTYSIVPCMEPLTGQGQALFFPDLVSTTTATSAEWDEVFAIAEEKARAAGLTEHQRPVDDDGNRFAEFSSSDGRTLRVLGRGNLVLTATIACRSTDGLVVDSDGSLPMPANP